MLRILLCLLLFAGPVWAKPQVVVVGGGLAGLISAWRLEQKGCEVTVLEAGDRFGGRVNTAHYAGGLEAEAGMQEIWEQSPLLPIVKELGLQLDSSDDPWSSFIIDDKLYSFVEDTRDAYFTKLFTPAERKQFQAALTEMEGIYREAREKGLTPRVQALQDMSYAEWLKARNLPVKVEQALRLTIEVELATVAERFSALSAILEYRSFLFVGEKNFHVPGGNDKIIARLAASIGGSKVLNAVVTHIERKTVNGKVHATVRYLKNSRQESVEGDAVVLAVPWVNLHQIQLDPPLTAPQLEALGRLGRGQYTVVHLLLDKAVTALWAKEDPFPVLSGGELGVLYGPHATETSGPNIVFSLLIYGPEAEAYHMAPRDIKRTEILEALDQYWPGFSKHVQEAMFYTYHPCAVTYWPKGRSPLDAGSKALRTPNAGLFLAGDWTESSHAEGAVLSAQEAVRQVEDYLAPRSTLR